MYVPRRNQECRNRFIISEILTFLFCRIVEFNRGRRVVLVGAFLVVENNMYYISRAICTKPSLTLQRRATYTFLLWDSLPRNAFLPSSSSFTHHSTKTFGMKVSSEEIFILREQSWVRYVSWDWNGTQLRTRLGI